MTTKKLVMRLLCVVIVLTTSSCQLLKMLESEPEPTATETSLPPTDTPTPTPSIPYPAPKLLERFPPQGKAQPLEQAVELVFDQPMDETSTSAAFSIEPEIKGDLVWSDARTLKFIPDKALSRGTNYTVTVDENAQNTEGLAIVEPVRFDFNTVGYLEITEVQPSEDSLEIDPDMGVTVVFNRPVVPLTSLDRQDELPDPLTFTPPVSGHGEWLNTSIYRFYPDASFLPATSYTARIAGGLTDTLGYTMAEDYVWNFTTESPYVYRLYPRGNDEHIGPNDVISVTFSQPMNHDSVEQAFSALINGQELSGDFSWSGGATPIAEETLVFTPDDSLPRDETCQVRLSKSAMAATGEATLARNVTWRFETVRTPGIISLEPDDGDTDVSVGHSLQIEFASPMNTDVFTEFLTLEPAPEEISVYWAKQNTKAYIDIPREPSTRFHVTLDSAAPDVFGMELGEDLDTHFTTGDFSPLAYIKTQSNVGTFDAYTNTVLFAQVRNISSLDIQLYNIPAEDLILLEGSGSWSVRSDYKPGPDALVRAWSVPVTIERNINGIISLPMVDEQGEQLPTGIYYIVMEAPEVKAQTHSPDPDTFIFVRSRVNLVLKQSLHESLVWATDLASGEPLADLPVTLYSQEGSQYSKGTTNAQGIYFTLDLPTNENNYIDLWEDAFIFAGQPGDQNFAVLYNGWNSGLGAWDFDLPYDYSLAVYDGYVYTDRPIYRPGQMVYFKGIIREDDDAAYTIPDMQVVDVTITDPDGTRLLQETLDVSDMGTFDSAFMLDDSAPLGNYYIRIYNEDEDFYTGRSFRVAEYRKPEFEVSVTGDKSAYINGEDIKVTTEASYYFGGAVADADVHWSLLSTEYWFKYTCPQGESCPGYSWSDYEWGDKRETYGSYGSLIANGDTVTDGKGQASFEVPADISDEQTSRVFTIESSITDISDQQVSNRGSVIVHQGEFYIGIAPRGRVAESGDRTVVDMLVVDWDSEAVADVDLDVVFMKHDWYSVREEAEDGYAYWTWATRDTPVYTTTVTTGDDGKVQAAFTPEDSGTYRVRVSGEDNRGNEIRSSTYIWVWGGGPAFWRQESNNRIDLIVDQESYDVGDTAKILVPSPFEGDVKALITVERGHLLDVEVVEVKGSAYLIEIPITEEHVPNMYVSVILVQGSAQNADELASFKMGMAQIPVSTASKALNITLTPDRDMEQGEYYHPRETVTYKIKVTDNSGNPVKTELSLRTADLAVLALADDNAPTQLERFWSERPLSVRTSVGLAEAMEAYNRELAPGAKGGGGGAETAGFVRSQFSDTAFWDPVVRTDVNGEAEVEITLPDNLTTWRTQARGITVDTLVGRVDSDVMSTLDVLVRPVLPRFFVVGDIAQIGVIVHNNTNEDLDADVMLDASGVSLSGDEKVPTTIPAGDKVEILWEVTVENVDEVTITLSADAGKYSDARMDTLPVYRYLTPEVMGTAGRISEAEARQEIVQLPREYDPERGELTVQIDGSLTAATQDSLKYLESYPYACTEQTVSRFLPNVMTYQALTELGIERPELKESLEESLSTALQRLYNEQHYDGGWGWWYSEESNAYLTAYVVHAMLEAYDAGFNVDMGVIQDGMEFIRVNLTPVTANSYSWRADRLAYELYVIAKFVDIVPGAKAGGELGYAISLFENRQLLNQYAKGQLAVALTLLGDNAGRADTLLDNLIDDAIFSATGTHWEEAKADYWNMNTDVHTTSVVIWTLAQLRPDSDLLPNAVRWLMSIRESEAGRDSQHGRLYWESTHTTSWALMSLVEYMRVSGELEGDFSFNVSLNGVELAEGDINQDTIDESTQVVVELADLLADTANRLIIEREGASGDQTGDGQLYYTAHLRYFQPANLVQAEDRGISVVRQYSLVDDPQTYIDGATVGDVIQVKLTVIAPTDLYYVMVEDPLPAGCEAVDITLNTTSVVGESPEVTNVTANEQDTWYRRYGWGWWYFSHSEMRDEKVSLFATYLPRGTYEYTYIMRASVAGEFNVIPTTASEMYFPEVWGRSDGGKFVIEP